jgi:hypothetical protein
VHTAVLSQLTRTTSVPCPTSAAAPASSSAARSGNR